MTSKTIAQLINQCTDKLDKQYAHAVTLHCYSCGEPFIKRVDDLSEISDVEICGMDDCDGYEGDSGNPFDW